jgi:hypothetical protein
MFFLLTKIFCWNTCERLAKSGYIYNKPETKKGSGVVRNRFAWNKKKKVLSSIRNTWYYSQFRGLVLSKHTWLFFQDHLALNLGISSASQPHKFELISLFIHLLLSNGPTFTWVLCREIWILVLAPRTACWGLKLKHFYLSFQSKNKNLAKADHTLCQTC